MTEPRCVNAHDLCWQGGPCPYCEKPTRKQTKGLAHILPICENKSPGRGNQAAAGENKQMTTANAAITVQIARLIVSGMTAQEAIKAICGADKFDAMVSELYEALRGAA